MSDVQETLPSLTEAQLEGVRDAIKEMCLSFMRQDAEKDLQKDITESVKEKYDVPKSVFKKLARLQYAANLAQEIAANEEFLDFAQKVLGDTENTLEYSEE